MAQAVDRGGAGSITVTVQEPPSASTSLPPSSSSANSKTPPAGQVLRLKLAPRRKKRVTWVAGTVDNEFMNKKSSKNCCIFHKEKPFDEDDSDEDDHDGHDHDKGKGQCHDAQNSSDGVGNSSHIACCSHSH